MRAQSHQPLLVLSRRRPGETARQVPSPDSGTEGPFDSDPFLSMSDFVHDIRIVPARKYIDECGEPLEGRHLDTSFHCHPWSPQVKVNSAGTGGCLQLLEIDNCFLDGKLS